MTLSHRLTTAVVVPEFAGEQERTEALVALANRSDSARQMFRYDLIRFAVSGTCADGMPREFSRYMTVV